MTIKQLKKEIKWVFKLPVKSYYFGKIWYGAPYFYPRHFNENILTIRKERPKFLRCKYFKLFGYEISYGWPIYVISYGLGWKMKHDSPRFEWSPSFQIYFFKWQFVIHWNAPDGNNDQYYEQILWFLHNKKYINKTKTTWGWTNYETGMSTWNNDYSI